MNRLNRYIVAIFLLLNFAQGVGMRLWMHHWFHESSSKSAGVACADDVQVKCDCLHDAMMPMQNAPSFELVVPPPVFLTRYFSGNISITSLDDIFCSLKGPPVVC